jgi:hypothetical protein
LPIAFSTLAFPDADLATVVSLGHSWGYAGVELRIADAELALPQHLAVLGSWTGEINNEGQDRP